MYLYYVFSKLQSADVNHYWYYLPNISKSQQTYSSAINLPPQDTAHHPEYAEVRRQQPTQAPAPSQ